MAVQEPRAISRPTIGAGARVLVAMGTALVVVAVAILPLLVPAVQHVALDAAGSAALLGLDPATTRDLSDRSVAGLVTWSGFDFPSPEGAPFYDPSEQAHLADARVLLWLLLGGAALAAAVIALAYRSANPSGRVGILRAVAAGGAATAGVTVMLGVVALAAFEPLFRLFHEVFFPGGGWAFDPASQRVVLLYPLAFWQIMAAALGLLRITFGAATWWLARRAAGGAR
jgi:hypothetical protein